MSTPSTPDREGFPSSEPQPGQDLWARAASGAPQAAPPAAPGWERDVLERLVFATVREQRAARLERELPFSYPMDAEQLFGIAAEETVLLQGVLDACFLEDGMWTIVDYKTDRVRPGESASAAAARHAEQLRLYALALESITGRRVKEAIVVLLSHRVSVRAV